MDILVTSTLKRKVTADEPASRSNIIFQLCKGLVTKGHRVSLLGTGDSIIEGVTTIPVIPKGWVDIPPVENQFFFETSSLIKLNQMLLARHRQFDIIHNHTYPDFFVPQEESFLSRPLVTTIHIQAEGYIDETFSYFKKTHFVSISQAHKSMFKKTSIPTVIHNGVDTDLFAYSGKKDDYLLWLGRLSKAKNPDGTFMDPKGVRSAIQLAVRTGSRLLLSGSVEDKRFFDTDVKPYLNDKIKWIGPVNAEYSLSKKEVVTLMQNARAYLMTVNWQEPFGLVMAEAGSCGTPVIGFDRGSVPELVVDGKTGFVVSYKKGVEGLIEAYKNIDSVKPENCREHVVRHFSVMRMVDQYISLYQTYTG